MYFEEQIDKIRATMTQSYGGIHQVAEDVFKITINLVKRSIPTATQLLQRFRSGVECAFHTLEYFYLRGTKEEADRPFEKIYYNRDVTVYHANDNCRVSVL